MSGDTTTAALPAPVKWAQRKDRVYLTICLEDVQEKQLDLTETRLTFSGVGGTERKPHSVTIDFHQAVNPEESRQIASDREIVMSIRKKEAGPYWPRLTADSVKRHWLKTDFNRWVDEDELDAREDDGEGGPGGPGGPGGFGGDANLEAMMAQLGGGFGGGAGGPGGFGGGDDDDDEFGAGNGGGIDSDDEGEGDSGEEADGEGEAAGGKKQGAGGGAAEEKLPDLE